VNKRIDSAAAATDEVKALVARARGLLDGYADTNALGVFMEPKNYRASVLEAIEVLTQAAAVMVVSAWPTKRDYDRV
jgi:hypothetical protein